MHVIRAQARVFNGVGAMLLITTERGFRPCFLAS
jgi:hypothetical protein